jgi:hypothetical protein
VSCARHGYAIYARRARIEQTRCARLQSSPSCIQIIDDDNRLFLDDRLESHEGVGDVLAPLFRPESDLSARLPCAGKSPFPERQVEPPAKAGSQQDRLVVAPLLQSGWAQRDSGNHIRPPPGFPAHTGKPAAHHVSQTPIGPILEVEDGRIQRGPIPGERPRTQNWRRVAAAWTDSGPVFHRQSTHHAQRITEDPKVSGARRTPDEARRSTADTLWRKQEIKRSLNPIARLENAMSSRSMTHPRPSPPRVKVRCAVEDSDQPPAPRMPPSGERSRSMAAGPNRMISRDGKISRPIGKIILIGARCASSSAIWRRRTLI